MHICPGNGNQRPVALAIKKEKRKTKYTPLTLSSGLGFAFTARNINFFLKEIGASKNFKILPRRFLRPRSTHACQLSSNPSRDLVPVKIKTIFFEILIQTCY